MTVEVPSERTRIVEYLGALPALDWWMREMIVLVGLSLAVCSMLTHWTGDLSGFLTFNKSILFGHKFTF